MRWCLLSLFADAHVYWKKRKRKSKIALFRHRTSMMRVSHWYPYLRQATKFGNFVMLFQKDGNFIYHNLLDPVQPFFAFLQSFGNCSNYMNKLIWKIFNSSIDISWKDDWKLLLFLFFPFWGKLQWQFSGPSWQSPGYDSDNSIGFHWNLGDGVVRDNDSFLPFLCFDFHLIVSICSFDHDCNRMYNKTSGSVGLMQLLDHRGFNLNKRGVLTTK